MKTYLFLDIKTEGFIQKVSINRPEALNALNETVLSELLDFFSNLDHAQNFKITLLSGAGEKAFVAGADIAAMKDLSKEKAQAFSTLGHKAFLAIENFPWPVIACVKGFALGGGLELALACDYIYADDTARLGLPEVGLGLIPGFGGTQRLTRLVGFANAKALVYSSQILSAIEAKEMGLVSEVFPKADFDESVLKKVSVLLKQSPAALQAAKRCLNQSAESFLASGLVFEQNEFGSVFESKDSKEGIAAFLEKRKPQYIKG